MHETFLGDFPGFPCVLDDYNLPASCFLSFVTGPTLQSIVA